MFRLQGETKRNHRKVGCFSWSFKLLMFCVLLLTLQMFGTPSMAHVLMCLLIPESNWSRSIWTRWPHFSLTTTSFHRIQPAQRRKKVPTPMWFLNITLTLNPFLCKADFSFWVWWIYLQHSCFVFICIFLNVSPEAVFLNCEWLKKNKSLVCINPRWLVLLVNTKAATNDCIHYLLICLSFSQLIV